MSTVNLGNQYITFDYKHPAKGSDFNTLLRDGIKAGVHSGGLITFLGSTITIAPFVIFIETNESGSNKLIRVQTRASIVLTVSESTPVIALTYTWQDISENWLDFNQRATGSAALSHEVCLGECVFTLGVITSIDYSGKTWGKQLTSDVADGTPPMAITSTTAVDNLNADRLDGYHLSDLPSFFYTIGKSLKLSYGYDPISASSPWFCMSLPNVALTTANYSAAFITELRSRKVIYDEFNTSVSAFTGSWTGSNFTLDNNAANVATITELAEDWLFAGSPASDWRVLVSNGIEYNITGFTVASRIIAVSGSPTGTSIEIYLNRVKGSTTSAMHFSWAGLGLYMTGQNKITGLRRRDKFQGHWHNFGDLAGNISYFSARNFDVAGTSGLYPGGSSYIVIDPIADLTHGAPRTGSKTEIESATVMLYLYVGDYTV